MKNLRDTFIVVCLLAFAVFFITGYCLNLYDLVHLAEDGVSVTSSMFDVRIIGIFIPPVGVVLGYL